MRRLVVVLAMIGGILFLCVYSVVYTGRAQKEVEAYTGAIFAAIDTKDSAALTESVDTFTDYWAQKERYLVRLVRHAQIDEISHGVSMLRSLTRYEDYSPLHAEVSSIAWKMEHLYDSERPTFGNIL